MIQLSTPVMFVIFNRLDVTKQVFEEIRKAKPEKLYIVSDSWREDKPNEKQKVLEVRKYVEDNIDWNCDIKKDYASHNLGCRKRVSTGITWVLSQEETVIVLEDDIVPTEDFFRYCQELLSLYKDDEKVMMISGVNPIEGVIKCPYTFSSFAGIWGWATWRRAWKYYDDSMSDWPQIRKKGIIKNIIPFPSYLTLRSYYDYVYRKTMDSWAYAWHYAMSKEQGMGIIPKENLVKNIGFDSDDATHTTGKAEFEFIRGKCNFPLVKISNIERNMEYDRKYINMFFPPQKAVLQHLKKVFLYIPRKIRSILF